jgi:hypothetical protein
MILGGDPDDKATQDGGDHKEELRSFPRHIPPPPRGLAG